MKDLKLTLFAILFAFTANLMAQNANCWQSSHYVLMGQKFNKQGLKIVKDKKAYVCFNDAAVSLFTAETGLITFNYQNTWSGIDSSFNNQVAWQGCSGQPGTIGWCEWTIDMTYNRYIKISKTSNGAFAVQLQNIGHTDHLPVVFSKPK